MFRKKEGFTLVELLVVIAIIVVLAAILFPVFAKARTRALLVRCLNNAKQMATAIEMYENDYDGAIMPCKVTSGDVWGYFWQDLLNPYLKALKRGQIGGSLQTEQGEIIMCAAAPLEAAEAGYWQTAKTYGYNRYLNRNTTAAEVKYPSVTLRLTEVASYQPDGNHPLDSNPPKNLKYTGGSWYAPTAIRMPGDGFWCRAPGWHDGMNVVLWVDGHVSSVHWTKVEESDGYTSNPNVWSRLAPKPGSSPD